MTLFENSVFADVIKMRSYWVTVGPQTSAYYLYQRNEMESWIQIHRGDRFRGKKVMWNRRRDWNDVTEIKECQWKLQRVKEGFFPGAFRLFMAPAKHGFWWSSLQNYENINFHCFILSSLVQFGRTVMSDSLWPHESQQARPPCPSPTPGVYSDPCPSSWRWHPAISSSVSPSPPAPNPSQHQGFFQWVNSSHEVAKVLELQLQHQSFQWTPRTDLL